MESQVAHSRMNEQRHTLDK